MTTEVGLFNSPENRWSLRGMTALVTGGTRGIGHAIVEELAGFGVAVHTCARKESELDQCLREWESKGFKVTGSVCDVKYGDQREKLMKSVSSIFNGKLNILTFDPHMEIANEVFLVLLGQQCWSNIPKEAKDYTAEDVATIMSINFESAYHLSQLSYPLLHASRNGSIVNISSIASAIGFPGSSIYAASKGAMEQITKNLACEWAKDNIRVNAIAPGLINTSLVDTVTEVNPSFIEFIEWLISQTPLLRIGEPKEISAVVTFLCCPAASFLTGQVIIVDGGLTISRLGPATSRRTD